MFWLKKKSNIKKLRMVEFKMITKIKDYNFTFKPKEIN